MTGADGSSISPDAVRAELERILASPSFRGAERSRTLLRFLVEHTLTGRGDHLKDYTLGAEALGRGEQFDPRTDPIARVEASRLRSRLDIYFATDGASDPLRISLPRGGYVPAFEARNAVATPAPASAAEAPDNAATTVSPSVPAERAAEHLRGRRSSGRRVAGVLVAGLVLAGGAAWWSWASGGGNTSVSPQPTHVELTTPDTHDAVSFALSPDGRRLVFVASAGGPARLWLRSLDTGTTEPLAGTEDASLPFWSGAGDAVGFFSSGVVKRLDLATGLVRTIANAPVPAGASWNDAGVLLHPVVPDSPLFVTHPDDHTMTPATVLTAGQTGHRGPQFLPDGRRFLFFAVGDAAVRGIYTGTLGTTAARRLKEADSPAVFVAPDHVLYISGDKLFAQRLDLESMTLAGAPAVIAEGVAFDRASGLPAVSASRTQVIAYRRGSPGGLRQLAWFDRHGGLRARLGTPLARGPAYSSLSPDEHRVAIQATSDGNTDIWILDTERGTPLRLSREPQADIAPLWSPDGTRIAYASQHAGVFDLVERSLDGEAPRPLLESPLAKQVTDWSRDGRYLLFRTITLNGRPDMDIWAMATGPDRSQAPAMTAPIAVVQTPFEERDGQFSPDARWLAYQSNESGQAEVYVQRFPSGANRIRISVSGGAQVRWRADGRELFYVALDGTLMAVPIEPRDEALVAGDATPLFKLHVGPLQGVSRHSYAVSRDGQRFLVDTLVEEAASPISLILNWGMR